MWYAIFVYLKYSFIILLIILGINLEIYGMTIIFVN